MNLNARCWRGSSRLQQLDDTWQTCRTSLRIDCAAFETFRCTDLTEICSGLFIMERRKTRPPYCSWSVDEYIQHIAISIACVWCKYTARIILMIITEGKLRRVTAAAVHSIFPLEYQVFNEWLDKFCKRRCCDNISRSAQTLYYHAVCSTGIEVNQSWPRIEIVSCWRNSLTGIYLETLGLMPINDQMTIIWNLGDVLATDNCRIIWPTVLIKSRVRKNGNATDIVDPSSFNRKPETKWTIQCECVGILRFLEYSISKQDLCRDTKSSSGFMVLGVICMDSGTVRWAGHGFH